MEGFKKDFLDRLFPLEWRENKIVEFINVLQAGMTVQEYCLKFSQLSKYSPIIVANHRARMSKFVLGAFSLVEKECHMKILLNDMDFF